MLPTQMNPTPMIMPPWNQEFQLIERLTIEIERGTF